MLDPKGVRCHNTLPFCQNHLLVYAIFSDKKYNNVFLETLENGVQNIVIYRGMKGQENFGQKIIKLEKGDLEKHIFG